jgi:hypothetical protein
MNSPLRHPKDFYAGLMYFSVGAAAAYIAKNYGMGSAVRMGPGYFPTLLAILLMIVGAVSLVRSFIRDGEAIQKFAWKPIGLIVGSVVLFGCCVRGAGLAPSLVILILLSASASPNFKWKTALILAALTTVFSVTVFVKGLSLPLPIFGSWFGM